MIKLYLDMDGVLADFNKAYNRLRTGAPDNHERFRDAVMIYKIFEDLDFMPDTQQLLNHVSRLKDIDVQILTSMGTFDDIRIIGYNTGIQCVDCLAMTFSNINISLADLVALASSHGNVSKLQWFF